MQRLQIFHETEYTYQDPVVLGRHRVLVRPRDGHDIRIESSKLAFSPGALVSWHRDELDNSVALATFEEEPVTRLTITSEVVVAHYMSDRIVVPLLDRASQYPFSYSATEHNALLAYLETDDSQSLDSWISGINCRQPTIDLLNQLCDLIYTSFNYQVRHEEGVQTVSETLVLGSGSCRDYAWLFVSACRQLGLAARFVSGYFHPAGTVLNDGDTHAWAEVYLPGAGWSGFDPTCNRMTAENHVPVSVALYPEDVPPVSGSFVGKVGENPIMNVTVHVTPC